MSGGKKISTQNKHLNDKEFLTKFYTFYTTRTKTICDLCINCIARDFYEKLRASNPIAWVESEI